MVYSEIIGVWLVIFFTLSIFSYLYDDNPFYKAAEHIFVGVSAGYGFAIVFWDTIWPNLFGRLFPDFVQAEYVEREIIYIIPLVLGIFMLCRLSNKLSWLARISIAYIIGMAAGLKFYALINSNIINQIEQTNIDFSSNLWIILNQIIIIIGVISGLVYFFFSKEHKGTIGKISKIGIYFLMIKFGSAFGFAVMGRISLLIGRIEELIKFSYPSYHYSTIIIFILMSLAIGYWAFKDNKSKEIT